MNAEAKNGSRYGWTALCVVAACGILLLLAGWVRSERLKAETEQARKNQQLLERLARMVKEYRMASKMNVGPSESKRYIRELLERSARLAGLKIDAMYERSVSKTDTMEEKRHTVRFKNATLQQVTRFLYQIRLTGRSILPVEIDISKDKASGKWKGEIVVHVTSVRESPKKAIRRKGA